MSEENTNNTTEEAQDANLQQDEQSSPNDEGEKLQEAGLKALQAERENRRAVEKKLKEALDKIKKYEDADKSEKERLNGEIERVRDELAESQAVEKRLSHELLARDVANAEGLPGEAYKRLQGDTRKELEADAKELKKLLAPNGPKKPDPVPQAGRSTGGKKSNGDIFQSFFESNFNN